MKFNRLNLVYFFVFISTAAIGQVPSFTSNFSGSTIGSGSNSVLEPTITTNESSSATDIAFKSKLPAGLVISTPANASFSGIDGVLTANSAGDSTKFSSARLGTNETLTTKAYVTSSTSRTNVYTSGDLTSSLGNSVFKPTINPRILGPLFNFLAQKHA